MSKSLEDLKKAREELLRDRDFLALLHSRSVEQHINEVRHLMDVLGDGWIDDVRETTLAAKVGLQAAVELHHGLGDGDPEGGDEDEGFSKALAWEEELSQVRFWGLPSRTAPGQGLRLGSPCRA